MKFTFLGAGSAASGIGDMIASALMDEGLSSDEAHQRLWYFNSRGLVNSAMDNLPEHIQAFAHDLPNHDFLEALEIHKPDILIGATGHPGMFTQEIIEKVASVKERPGIFALSNPTSRAECTAEQAYTWTDGRAIFASGSPFDPVNHNGKVFSPGQGNNSYIFPGVGLGMIACKAKYIPDSVFMESARALAATVTDADLEAGSLYPVLDEIREVSLHIATAVAEYAYENDLAMADRPDDIRAHIQSLMYEPDY